MTYFRPFLEVAYFELPRGGKTHNRDEATGEQAFHDANSLPICLEEALLVISSIILVHRVESMWEHCEVLSNANDAWLSAYPEQTSLKRAC